MKYKFIDKRYTWNNAFRYMRDCTKHAMDILGHEEVEDSLPADINFYNHCTIEETESTRFLDSLILKPTGPSSNFFSIDEIGYANSSSIVFDEPFEYEFYKITDSNRNYITQMINDKANKWDYHNERNWSDAEGVPDDHILIIGQCPADETVTRFSFGNHWTKLCAIVDELHLENLVIKLHPRHYKKENRDLTPDIYKKIQAWEKRGHLVIKNYVSIHTILPHTRVAITENSTAGIECMMHNIPIVSYGYPEYHWVTNDLRILSQLPNIIDNLDWFKKEKQEQFLHWYLFDYLCNDIDSTIRRLKCLDMIS